jgi:RNA polymerase sigma-70 factor (ECF subfamily)
MGESFESVLAAAQLGAEWAWRVLYESTAPRVRSYLSFRGAVDPDGLVGDVFLAAAKGIVSFEGGEENFRSWVFSIAHARLVDERRKRERRRTEPTDSSDLELIADMVDVETVVLGRLMYYNFARRHQSLGGQTPAMAAGIADHPWTVWDIAELID